MLVWGRRKFKQKRNFVLIIFAEFREAQNRTVSTKVVTYTLTTFIDAHLCARTGKREVSELKLTVFTTSFCTADLTRNL